MIVRRLMTAAVSDVVSKLARETARDRLIRSLLDNVEAPGYVRSVSCPSVVQEQVLTVPSE